MMKRLWGIRHVRYVVKCYRVNRHYHQMQQFGFLPIWAESDVEQLDKIWRGEA